MFRDLNWVDVVVDDICICVSAYLTTPLTWLKNVSTCRLEENEICISFGFGKRPLACRPARTASRGRLHSAPNPEKKTSAPPPQNPPHSKHVSPASSRVVSSARDQGEMTPLHAAPPPLSASAAVSSSAPPPLFAKPYHPKAAALCSLTVTAATPSRKG